MRLGSLPHIKTAMALCLATAATSAHAADAPSPYAPLRYLVGHCWKGTLPNGKDVDTHCFRWLYSEKFVRDEHTAHGAGHPDYLGESTYYFDSTTKTLRYLYLQIDGGTSGGDVEASDITLTFPAATYQEGGKTQTYRSRWTRSGDDAYDVVTEFQKGDKWAPGWTVHMIRVAAP
jgi:hypothetical protein